MDMMNCCRTELHVAQQSRRDKLRAQQLNDFSNSWDNSDTLLVHQNHHQIQSGINAGSPHNPALPPAGLIGFLQNQIAIPVQADTYQDCTATFLNMPSSPAVAGVRDVGDPQVCGNWKTVDSSQLSCDNWSAVNYGDGQAGRASNVGNVFSNNFNARNDMMDRPMQCSKPMYDAGQDVTRSSMSSSEISSQDDTKKYHLSLLYQNSFQNLVTVACSGTGTQNDTRESGYEHCSWSGNSRGELVFLPSYGNHQPDSWVSRPVGNYANNQWNHESGSNVPSKCDDEPRNFATASAKKGLSLSISPEVPKPSIISKSSGKSLADVVGGGVAASLVNNVQRHVGPLGPFTGYATILKSSRFSKPAQQLLDEFCNAYVSRITTRYEANSMNAANASTEQEGGGKFNDDSAMLSSTIRSCNDVDGCSSSEPFKPENRLKKAKLNLLQEEVSRRYKLYSQQMQTVVSSFESVAGLSTATPYISVAIRRISGSFRSLRNAITDQLMQISRLSGNDYGTNQTSSTKFTDSNNNNNNNNNNSFQKQRSMLGNNVGILEPQPIWRPQRGLPERAVAILRAWLFDHFLHPYPTDTDKQMLATQTGLSRNQVSNWFINARVRVWKPMVEEMHMLETKAMTAATDTNQRSVPRTEPTNNVEHSNRPTSKQPMELHESISNCNVNGAVLEKRSRVEYTRGNADLSGLMGFMPYSQRGGFDTGLGNVSLTLGLRHGVDSVPQTQTQTRDHEFGGAQMFHDFVG